LSPLLFFSHLYKFLVTVNCRLKIVILTVIFLRELFAIKKGVFKISSEKIEDTDNPKEAL